MKSYAKTAKRLNVFAVIWEVLVFLIAVAVAGLMTSLLILNWKSFSTEEAATFTEGVTVLVNAIFALIATIHARKILRCMSQGNPFCHAVTTGFKKLQGISIFYCAVTYLLSFLDSILTNFFYEKVFDLAVETKEIVGFGVKYTVPILFLFVAAAFGLFSQVFRHAGEIQSKVNVTEPSQDTAEAVEVAEK